MESQVVLGRRRLLDQLLRAVRGGSVVTIEGPAGYGKSTLIGRWALESEIAMVSITISPQYDDDVALGRALGEELLTLDKDPDSPLRELLTGSFEVARHFMPVLLKWLARHRVLVVFDDVHLLTDPGSIALVQTLVTHTPAPSILVLSGRSLPAIKLGRAGVQGRHVHLNARNLELTADDLKGDPEAGLAPEVVDEIIAAAGGWPAGISLSLAARRVVGNAGESELPQTLTDYVNEEVLGSLSADQRRFLGEVAITGPQTARALDAARGRTDSAQMIAALRRDPIPMVRTGMDWIGVHAILGAQVRAQLITDEPEHRVLLLRRLAEHCEANGDVGAAFDVLGLLHDHARSTAFVELHGPLRIMGGDFALPAQWLRRLAKSRDGLSPSLQLLRASTIAMEGKTDSASAWYELLASAAFSAEGFEKDPAFAARLGIAFDSIGMPRPFDIEVPPVPPGDGWGLGPEIMRSSRRAFTGDLVGAANILQALETYSAPYALAEVWRAGQLAWVLRELGEIDSAKGVVRAAEPGWLAANLDRNPTTCQYQCLLAMAALDDGDLDVARAHFNSARVKASELQGGIAQERFLASMLLGSLARQLGDSAAMKSYASQGRKLKAECADSPYLLEVWARVEPELDQPEIAGSSSLSAAELRVLSYLGSYYTVPQIAEVLHVSPATVRSQSQSIYRKFGVNNRSEAVAMAQAQGFVH